MNAVTKQPDLDPPIDGDPMEPYIGYLTNSYYQCVLKHDALIEWVLR